MKKAAKKSSVPNDAPEDVTTVSFRLRTEKLAALDAKAREKSLNRSSLIILAINELLEAK